MTTSQTTQFQRGVLASLRLASAVASYDGAENVAVKAEDVASAVNRDRRRKASYTSVLRALTRLEELGLVERVTVEGMAGRLDFFKTV